MMAAAAAADVVGAHSKNTRNSCSRYILFHRIEGVFGVKNEKNPMAGTLASSQEKIELENKACRGRHHREIAPGIKNKNGHTHKTPNCERNTGKTVIYPRMSMNQYCFIYTDIHSNISKPVDGDILGTWYMGNEKQVRNSPCWPERGGRARTDKDSTRAERSYKRTTLADTKTMRNDIETVRKRKKTTNTPLRP